MIFILKSLAFIISLLIIGVCALGARIALSTRDHFVTLCCGGGAIGMLALVVHFIF